MFNTLNRIDWNVQYFHRDVVYIIRDYLIKVMNSMSGHNPGMDMALLGALAEPNGMNIVELLRYGPLTVGEIAEQLGLFA